MTKPAIQVDHLSKRYRLGLTHAGSVRELARRTIRRLRGLPPVEATIGQVDQPRDPSTLDHSGDFWALRDVSFEVQPGEVVGIIGRNGAGKSTLLKILSQITRPTGGRALLRGRVASLLEVGTGFHPEMTGRENVYMNGTILGMTRREVARRFDEIVAFAGVEQFIDTPVKRYSSGMQVRLGFAVAAHLDPEILIVDEVLAVGDAEFQRKCLGALHDAATGGRAVLLVSHNMSSVSRLTTRSLLLRRGQLAYIGSTDQAISLYLREMTSGLISHWVNDNNDRTTASICEIKACDSAGITASRFSASDDIYLTFAITVAQPSTFQIAFRLNNADEGSTIFTSAHRDVDGNLSERFSPGNYRAQCRMPGRLLRPGRYSILAALNSPHTELLDLHDRTVVFDVTEVSYAGSLDNRLGIIAPMLDWRMSEASAG